MTGFYDDGLFGKLFTEAQREEHGPGHSVELYERAGASLELLEDEEGVCVSEVKERGFALRLFRGGRVGFAAAGPEGLALLLPRARSLLPRARVRRGARAATPLAGEPPAEPVTGAPNVPDEAAAREILVDFRRAVTRAGGGAVAVREASVVMGERRERIATSGGREASWTSRAASLIAHLAGRAKEGRFSARVVANAARAEELPIARLARLGVDRVLLPLTGHAAPTGRVDVLLDSHVAAHLIGRLAPFFFGDAQDALLASRTRGGKDGLTSPVLSLVDDIAAPGGPIRIPRDGEGTPKRRTVVVERGMVTGRLTDVASAVRRETTSSGNAIRRLWSEPPAVGVTNFFVDPSPGVSPLDLLASVTKGVYAAVLLERPDIDLAADRFRLVTAGYTIEKGRAAHRVSETVLSGRLSELLRGIASIGDDLKFVAGAGGGVGSPTLYIPRWKLG